MREEVLQMEEELLRLGECAPLGASRDSETGLRNEEDIAKRDEIDTLMEGLESGTVCSKYNAPPSLCWTVVSMMIMLGMVYVATTGMQGSVGTTPIKGISSCWANTTSHVTASRPISWKLPEAVGTVVWCSWEELKDPGYRDTWETCGAVFDYCYMALAYLIVVNMMGLGIFATIRRVYMWRMLRC